MLKPLYVALLLIFNIGIYFLIAYQAKTVEPTIKNLLWFFTKTTPFLILLNTGIGFGFSKFYKLTDNLMFTAVLNMLAAVTASVIVACILAKKFPTLKEIIGILIIMVGVFIVNMKNEGGN